MVQPLALRPALKVDVVFTLTSFPISGLGERAQASAYAAKFGIINEGGKNI
jgi:hypothetical protein